MSTRLLAAWIAVAALAVLRPGVDALDRSLVFLAWRVPSGWNALAEVAIRTDVVDAAIDGRAAPWRHASVVKYRGRDVAVVVVSDFSRSRATFIDDRYTVLGSLARLTSPPAVVTDEMRGYKPISHAWPLDNRDGRIVTLISSVPMVSMPPSAGVFSYVELGPVQNEILFVCRLQWAPGPFWGVLDRIDEQGDGRADFVVRAPADARGFGSADRAPLATFLWDDARAEYVPHVSEAGARVVSWWSTHRGAPVRVPRDEPLDPIIDRLPLVGGAR